MSTTTSLQETLFNFVHAKCPGFADTVSEYARSESARQGLSRLHLAEHLDMSKSTMETIWSGPHEYTFTGLQRLSRALGTPIADLFRIAWEGGEESAGNERPTSNVA